MSPSDAAGLSPAFDLPADAQYHQDLVLGVLEHQRVNYLASPPRIGKSCLLYPQLAQYLECRKFLGCTDGRHEPTRLGLITQLSANYIRSRLKSMGVEQVLTTKTFPIETVGRSHHEDSWKLANAVEHALSKFKTSPEVVVIDNLHSLLPSGEVSKFKEAGDFVLELTHLAEQFRTTFLATVPMVKQKQNEGYIRAIDRIMGTVNWLHGAGTVGCFDYFNVRISEALAPRKLTLTFHGRPEMESYWRFVGGKLACCPFSQILPDAPPREITQARNNRFADLLRSYAPNEEISIDLMLAWAAEESISDATLYRWIQEQIKLGKLQRLTNGRYVRTKPN